MRSLPNSILTSTLVLLAATSTLLAGPLNPPAGPVASTAKPLIEVEPRTAINATNTPTDGIGLFVISQPGSYYLTGNITGVSGRSGIRIVSSNVTLDLNGFSIAGVAGALHGLAIDASLNRITIRNGHINAFGIHGISAATVRSVTIEDVTIESCGGNGFDLGDGTRIEGCTARSNTGNGIRVGSSSLVNACVANANATGIELNSSSTVSNCVISGNTSRGILAAGSDGVARNNTISASTTTAIGVTISGNRISLQNNVVTGNPGTTGLFVTGANNSITGNIVRGFSANYNISPSASNQVDLIVSQLPETIAFPCNARLTGSLTATTASGGILIASDGVTLDLGGHDISGVGTSGAGISVQGTNRRGITVRNGSVRRFTSGGVILVNASAPKVENIHANNNTGYGISTSGGQILDCVSNDNIGIGIYGGDDALIARCTANFNTGDNIQVNAQSTIQDCTANSGSGHGIHTLFILNSVINCTANNNTASGVRAEQRTRVSGCTVYGNREHGVYSSFGGTIEGCTIGGPGATGIFMDAGGLVTIRNNTLSEFSANNSVGIKIINAGLCRIDNNQIGGCWRSLDVTSGGNFITSNSSNFAGAGGHYSIVGGNSFGPIVVVGGVGNISGTANSNHPDANFVY